MPAYPTEILAFHIYGVGITGYAGMAFYETVPGRSLMAEKIMFLSPRASDRAVLSPSSQVATLPATNVQDQEPSRVWRTTGTANQYIDFTLPSAIACNAAAITWPYESLSQQATGRLFAYSGGPGITPVLDSGIINLWPEGFKHTDPDWGHEVGLVRIPANNTAYLYWRLYINDPAPIRSYLDIGRVAIGRAVQFKVNPRYDGGIGFVPIDIQEPNGYGQIFTDARPYQQRQFELVWTGLAEKEVEEDAMELSRLRGQAGDVFVFLDPMDIDQFHRKSMQAIFEGQAKYKPMPNYMPDKDGTHRLAWSFTMTLTQKL